MPKRVVVTEHLSLEAVRLRYVESETVKARCHWQVIYLMQQGRPSEQVAHEVGYSVPWVRQLVGRYNARGPQAVGDGRAHNRGAAPVMDEAVRHELRQVLEEPVPAELGGGLWNGVKVALWLERKLERPVHRQRGHEALQGAGWSCQEPRPRHAQADHAAQEAFKKN